MNRREFLLHCVGGAAAAALSGGIGRMLPAEAMGRPRTPVMPATVAIQRFSDERKAARAVNAALERIGGIDRIVSRGDLVVIKPNLVNATAGRWVGRTTNTRVTEAVIKAVIDCGGRPVVAEGTAEQAFGTTTGFAEQTGLLEVCRKCGAEFVDLNNDEPVPVRVPQPILWSEIHLARRAVECNRFISVPVMKVHRAAGVTLGMKNLIGITSAKVYGIGAYYTRAKLHNMERRLWEQQFGGDMIGENEIVDWAPLGATIADLVSARPIDLVVVDGTFGEERNSPEGDLVDIKERCGSYLILAGTDTVAVDAVGAHIMRQMPERLQKLRFATAKNIGTSDISKIAVVGERLDEVAVPLRGYPLVRR